MNVNFGIIKELKASVSVIKACDEKLQSVPTDLEEFLTV